jgi:hypothetical protein
VDGRFAHPPSRRLLDVGPIRRIIGGFDLLHLNFSLAIGLRTIHCLGGGVHTSQRRVAESWKESVRPKGVGVLSAARCTQTDRSNRKGAGLFNG